MNKIVELKCNHRSSDWVETYNIKIDVEKYTFFEIDYRGENMWYIIGHWCEEGCKWKTKELSEHGVINQYELASFIVKVNSIPYGKKDEFTRNRISRFNNLHYNENFYRDLGKLLNIIREKEDKLKSK